MLKLWRWRSVRCAGKFKVGEHGGANHLRHVGEWGFVRGTLSVARRVEMAVTFPSSGPFIHAMERKLDFARDRAGKGFRGGRSL